MELEQRIEILEQEVKTLKAEIHSTLIGIRESLPAQPSAPERWQKKAWILALINVLIAIVLFTNIYLYLPGDMPLGISATLQAWLRAFWLALAFIWLLLQMYPLALLLEQEEQQWRAASWRTALVFLRAQPGFILALTLTALIVAIVNMVIPAVWLIVALALLVGVGSMALRNVLCRQEKQAK